MKLHSIDEFFKSPAGIDFIIEDRINSKMTNNTQPSQQVPSNADLELIIECNPSMLLATIKEKTAFDARLMAIVFDLAKAHVRTLLAQSPAASDAGLADDAKRLNFIKNLTWEVRLVRADGHPMTKAEKWAAGFANDATDLTTEWSVSFNTDYGMTGDQDDIFLAIDAALASQEPQHG